MKKEMICICRIEDDVIHYGKVYETSELGKAKTEAMRLMKKTPYKYRIYLCSVYVDEKGLFGGFAQFGGYWENVWSKTWRYYNNPKFQEAYVGMEVEINLKSTANITGTIEFGKIIDADNLVVELESGVVVYYKNNPWEKGNEDKRYFNFIADIYPAPQRYNIEHEHYQYKDNHIFDRKSETSFFTSYKSADKEFQDKELSYTAKAAKSGGKNEVVPIFPGFEYRERRDGALLVERYKLVGNNQTYNRF